MMWFTTFDWMLLFFGTIAAGGLFIFGMQLMGQL